MKRLVVATLEALSILLMGVWILASGGAAYVAAGKSVAAGIGGLVGGFLVSVVVFGVLFIILEMNENLRRLVKLSEDNSRLARLSVATLMQLNFLLVDNSQSRDLHWWARSQTGQYFS